MGTEADTTVVVVEGAPDTAPPPEMTRAWVREIVAEALAERLPAVTAEAAAVAADGAATSAAVAVDAASVAVESAQTADEAASIAEGAAAVAVEQAVTELETETEPETETETESQGDGDGGDTDGPKAPERRTEEPKSGEPAKRKQSGGSYGAGWLNGGKR